MILLLKRLFCVLVSMIQAAVILHGGEQKPMIRNLDVDILVSPRTEYQQFTGFGSSACWWSQIIGASDNAERAARLLYSPEGLGLNIYRYNVGGGEKDNPASRISGSRATESFYYLDSATGEYKYDFTRDAAAQRMLELALSYGCVDTVVLFANSPHYSMTVTGQATGGLTENFSNLPPENYEAFADYFITITRYFVEKGIPVKFISPINEPQWSWGGGWVGQEGCHYEPDEVIEVMRVFARKLKDSGLPVKLMAPESGEIGEVTGNYFEKLVADPEIAPVLGSLAYHSYWADGDVTRKTAFGEYLAGKQFPVPVDMTEWCELPLGHSTQDFASVMRLAETISDDLTHTGANSWTAWVGVNTTGYKDGERWSDGLLAMNDDGSLLEVCSRYYAMAHFSKFIPAGSVRVKASPDADDTVITQNEDGSKNYYERTKITAFRTPDNKIVVVLVNEGNDRDFTFTCLGKTKLRVVQSTADYKLKELYSGLSRHKISVPHDSVTTAILE